MIILSIYFVSNQEVIAGKCSVLCISNDSRNSRPSDEALKKADFVFCRTFDVGKQEVCNEICEKIAGVEGLSSVHQNNFLNSLTYGWFVMLYILISKLTVSFSIAVKFLLNKVDTSKDVKRTDKDGKDASGIATVNTESEDPSGQNISNGELTLKPDESSVKKSTEENVDLKVSLPIEKSSNEEKSGACASDGGNGLANTSSKQENILDDKVSPKLKIDSNETPGKDVKALAKDDEGRVKNPRDSAEVEHRPAKKAKLDSSVQLSHGKTKSDIQKLGLNRNNGDTLASSPKVLVSEDASRTKHVKDSQGTKDSLIKKPKLDEKPTKVSNGKNLKVSSQISSVTDCKIDGQIVEVTRRPDAVSCISCIVISLFTIF